MGKSDRILDKKPIFDEVLLTKFLIDYGVNPKVHMKSIWKSIFDSKNEKDFAKNFKKNQIPQHIISPLLHEFKFLTSRVTRLDRSRLDGTTKFLLRLENQDEVECVIINHTGVDQDELKKTGERNRLKELRKTLCVSSQVGCNLGCSFCATGTMKLKSNLTSGEIMEQLIHAELILKGCSDYFDKEVREEILENGSDGVNNILPGVEELDIQTTFIKKEIHNIVFMGMGEPLENYDNVINSLKGFNDGHRFKLAQRNCTLSTVGIVPRMKQLFKELPNIRLALSLHAPNQKIREEIVPVAKLYKLDTLIDCLDEFQKNCIDQNLGKKNGHVMISYILIDNVNDRVSEANELCTLLEKFKKNITINLIPFNPFALEDNLKKHKSQSYKTSKPENVLKFLEILQESGYKAFERRPHGRDINAACGQLVKAKKNKILHKNFDKDGVTLLAKEEIRIKQEDLYKNIKVGAVCALIGLSIGLFIQKISKK